MNEYQLLGLAERAIRAFREAEEHRLTHRCISSRPCHEWFHAQNAACLRAMDFEDKMARWKELHAEALVETETN